MKILLDTLWLYSTPILLSLFVVVCLLHVIYALVSATTGTTGLEAASINQQVALLKTQNLRLQDKILEARSLRIIEAKARAMGFIDGSIIYL